MKSIPVCHAVCVLGLCAVPFASRAMIAPLQAATIVNAGPSQPPAPAVQPPPVYNRELVADVEVVDDTPADHTKVVCVVKNIGQMTTGWFNVRIHWVDEQWKPWGWEWQHSERIETISLASVGTRWSTSQGVQKLDEWRFATSVSKLRALHPYSAVWVTADINNTVQEAMEWNNEDKYFGHY